MSTHAYNYMLLLYVQIFNIYTVDREIFVLKIFRELKLHGANFS